MLVLARKLGEKVYVGNDIVVTVVEVHGAQVRLGFDRPVQIPVLREEVYRHIHGEQAADGPLDAPEVSRYRAEFA